MTSVFSRLWYRRHAAAALVAFCGAAPAHAHAPVPGIEGFYVGLLDPVSAAPQLVLLLALGFLIAGFENRHVIWLMPAFLVATLLGIVFGASLENTEPALLATAALGGALAAAAPGRFLGIAIALTIVAGVLIGAISIPDPGPMRDRIVTVFGSFVGANVALLYVVGGVLFLREKYPDRAGLLLRIASALAGSIAAILLVLRLGAPV